MQNYPILLIIFNRPRATEKVFESIRAAKPSRLYVAADGPRDNSEDDYQRCDEAKQIATKIDWPCELHTLFREKNLGCKLGPATAIDWFFKHEECGIILEDDVLPLPSFYLFCNELLEKYRDDERVTMISGCNLISKRFRPIESYFFVQHTHIWGWATWRRAWMNFDVTIRTWPLWKEQGGLLESLGGDTNAAEYWTKAFDAVHRYEMDAWDYQWTYACWRAGGLSVLPEYNLTQNLGFGVDATHTFMQPPLCVIESAPQELNLPLIHPKEVRKSNIADGLIKRFVYGIKS